MASPRDASASSTAHIDPILHAILADIDSLKARVALYIQTDQTKQVHTRKLEMDLAAVQHQLAESRKEIERLKEMQDTVSNANGHRPGHSSKADPETLRRRLRNSHRIDTNEDPPSPAQSSIMGSSPSTHYQDAQFHSMAAEDLDASATFAQPEPTPRSARATRAKRSQHDTETPMRAARTARYQPFQPLDEPEQASPVQRTPKLKKTQSLGANEVAAAAEQPVEPGRSSAPPSADSARRDTHADTVSKGKLGGSAPREKGSKPSRTKATGQTPGDPYETDVTYNGLEEVSPDVGASHGQVRPSDVAKGKRPAAPADEEIQPPTMAPQICVQHFPENRVLHGPLKSVKLVQTLACHDVIERLASMKEDTSFYLSVHGEFIFVKDPIVVDSPAQLCLLTWGYPYDHEAIRDYVWGKGDDRRPTIDYHTFVYSHTALGSTKLRWYYIGKLRWAECETAPKWPRYDVNSQQSLADKLIQTWEAEAKYNQDDIIYKIQHDEWPQLCIELSNSDELANASLEFLHSTFPDEKQGNLSKNTSLTSI